MRIAGLLTKWLILANSYRTTSYLLRGNTKNESVSLDLTPPSTDFTLTEDVPDDYVTDITWKANGKRLAKTTIFVDGVLALVPLSTETGWNNAIPSVNYVVGSTRIKIRNNQVSGSPGFMTKTAMWSIRHVVSFMQQEHRFQEASFTSKFGDDGPILGFGQMLNDLPAALATNSTEDVSAEDDVHNATVRSFAQGSTSTDIQANSGTGDSTVYTSDFHRRSTYQLSDYGIYITLMSLMISQTAAAAQAPGGLDTVVRGMANARNEEFDITVAIGSSSAKSDSLTIRKILRAIPDLAVRMSQFGRQDRYRSIDFLVREDDGGIIGRGVVVRGLPPVQAENILDLDQHVESVQ